MRKKRIYLLIGALAGCLASTAVTAQESPLYLGAKAAWMDVDAPGFDEAVNIGALVGYDLVRETYGVLSIEGEITTTLSDGDRAGGGDWDADTLAVYGAFRTLGDVYGKLRAGFLDQDIKFTGGGSFAGSDDSGFAWGLGGGFRLSPTSALELEYTDGSEDLSFLSLAYLLRF